MNMRWMEFSIDISKKAPQSLLRTGAVLVSNHNELVCSAYTGEEAEAPWSSILLSKIRKLEVFSAQGIYLTINTLSPDGSFDLAKVLGSISVSEIYVGIPDPLLTEYLDDDPVVKLDHVNRYPDRLQHRILELNKLIYAESQQSIKYSPYYCNNRISDLVIANLGAQGFNISKDELNAHKQESDLATLICRKYGVSYAEVIGTVHNAISEAFNSKYGTYNYLDDTRSLASNWKEYFMSVYKNISMCPLSDNSIINVGVGGGQEAISLFSGCTRITFVDIAQLGLKRLKEQFPLSTTIVSSADALSSIPDNSYDLYISLRTYNSSFFNIEGAISEAYRVLKPGALIVVSVANGFLHPERNRIIPGLIIPGTEFVDVYRSMDVAELMRMQFLQTGFRDVRRFLSNTEVYLAATTAK